MPQRLWRLRRRQQSIDAILHRSAGEIRLEYLMNGRRLTIRRWPTRARALKAALEKRKELERAGWATHW